MRRLHRSEGEVDEWIKLIDGIVIFCEADKWDVILIKLSDGREYILEPIWSVKGAHIIDYWLMDDEEWAELVLWEMGLSDHDP